MNYREKLEETGRFFEEEGLNRIAARLYDALGYADMATKLRDKEIKRLKNVAPDTAAKIAYEKGDAEEANRLYTSHIDKLVSEGKHLIAVMLEDANGNAENARQILQAGINNYAQKSGTFENAVLLARLFDYKIRRLQNELNSK